MCLLSYMLNKTIVFLNYEENTGGIDLYFVGKDIYEENQLYNSKHNLNIYSGGTSFLNNNTGWYEDWKQKQKRLLDQSETQERLLDQSETQGRSLGLPVVVDGIPVNNNRLTQGLPVVKGISTRESNYIVILRDGEHFESFTKKDSYEMVLFSEEALKIINDLIEKKRVKSPIPFQSYMTIDEIIVMLIIKREGGGGNKKRTIKRKQNRKKTNKKKKKKKRNKSNKKR